MVDPFSGHFREERSILAFCPNCGTKLNDGAKFCTNCGTPQTPVAPVQPVAQEEPVTVYEPQPPVQEYRPPQQEAPAQTYQPPAQEYQAPQQSYQTPQQNYQPPQGGKPPKAKKKVKPLAIILPVAGVLLVGIIVLLVVLLGGGKVDKNVYGKYDIVASAAYGYEAETDGEWVELKKGGKGKLFYDSTTSTTPEELHLWWTDAAGSGYFAANFELNADGEIVVTMGTVTVGNAAYQAYEKIK